ncbi:hypothetical protein WR25_17257 isoform B [Diploscapter pachys]|uniref:SANT domain-containing protein n=1 Tax=Diploscapter pachys TaxID=2018661 RepID=A0A2A2LRL4_9BILA|nr:hypothetical protein WR25_17257 isoform B [Diploscapter pachys]
MNLINDFEPRRSRRLGDDDPLSEHRERTIQVGEMYQAVIGNDEETKREGDTSQDDEREELLWMPNSSLDSDELNQYCKLARMDYDIPMDRALFILQNCNYDIAQAKKECSKRRIVKDIWGHDDRVLFKYAFHQFGKNFGKMRQMLPHRSISSIVQFYYNSKKQTDYRSRMDVALEYESDDDEAITVKSGGYAEPMYQEGICENCGQYVFRLHTADDESQLFFACKAYYKVFKYHKSITGIHNLKEHPRRVRIPAEEDREFRGAIEMFIEFSEEDNKNVENYEASSSSKTENANIEVVQKGKNVVVKKAKELEREIMMTKSQAMRDEIALKNMKLDELKSSVQKYRSNVYKDDRRDDESSTGGRTRVRHPYSWTDAEKQTAFQAILRYGLNFEFVSEIVRTKSADMIKSFYSEYKDDIDTILEGLKKKREAEARALIEQSFAKTAEVNQPEVLELE